MTVGAFWEINTKLRTLYKKDTTTAYRMFVLVVLLLLAFGGVLVANPSFIIYNYYWALVFTKANNPEFRRSA